MGNPEGMHASLLFSFYFSYFFLRWDLCFFVVPWQDWGRVYWGTLMKRTRERESIRHYALCLLVWVASICVGAILNILRCCISFEFISASFLVCYIFFLQLPIMGCWKEKKEQKKTKKKGKGRKGRKGGKGKNKIRPWCRLAHSQQNLNFQERQISTQKIYNERKKQKHERENEKVECWRMGNWIIQWGWQDIRFTKPHPYRTWLRLEITVGLMVVMFVMILNSGEWRLWLSNG